MHFVFFFLFFDLHPRHESLLVGLLPTHTPPSRLVQLFHGHGRQRDGSAQDNREEHCRIVLLSLVVVIFLKLSSIFR